MTEWRANKTGADVTTIEKKNDGKREGGYKMGSLMFWDFILKESGKFGMLTFFSNDKLNKNTSFFGGVIILNKPMFFFLLSSRVDWHTVGNSW